MQKKLTATFGNNSEITSYNIFEIRGRYRRRKILFTEEEIPSKLPKGYTLSSKIGAVKQIQ